MDELSIVSCPLMLKYNICKTVCKNKLKCNYKAKTKRIFMLGIGNGAFWLNGALLGVPN